MLYLSITKNQIKLLHFKKTIINQYEVGFFEKKHQVDLLENGNTPKIDIVASAVKEALTTSVPNTKEKEICLVLPQDVFHFLRVEIPKDMAASAITPFIKDKAHAQLNLDLDTCFYDYLVQDNEVQKQILFFAIEKTTVQKFTEAFHLLNLQITAIVPEVLAYFKLFEKTLRRDKKEYIMYVSYEKNQAIGYFYDTYGPLEDQKWSQAPVDDTTIEGMLKTKATEYEAQGKKLNRLILSGESSENVRQDTFTKNVGVWTNPLKRILPNFYQDYLKLLVPSNNQQLPFLTYDVCIGTFIFTLENKNFSLLKKRSNDTSKTPSMNSSKFTMPIKPILFFTASFMFSFAVLMLISKLHIGSLNFGGAKSIAQISPTQPPVTPTSTPTPTPNIDRSKMKIKVLNGSGIKGKATDVKDSLKTAGYEEILTGNADSFDYTTTEIQVKKDNTALGDLLKSDLKSNVSEPKITTLDAKETADAVIIVGTDFK